MTPTGPTPKWATGCSGVNCRPKPAEYQKFVQALATRYSGKYKDENQGGGTLPKVQRFSLWNEPNEKGWLLPQSTGVNAGIYRGLVTGGMAGLKKAKFKGPILLGDMAPLHNSLLFWANLMCIDLKGKVLKGKAATKADCKSGKKLKRFAVDGVSIHPYDRGGQPPFKKPKKYDVNLAGLPKLEALLDKAGKLGVLKKNIPIYFTEFGVSTRPEETKFGVTYTQQAEAINHAEYVGYLDKRVKSYAQYELNNDSGDRVLPDGSADAVPGHADEQGAELRRLPDAAVRGRQGDQGDGLGRRAHRSRSRRSRSRSARARRSRRSRPSRRASTATSARRASRSDRATRSGSSGTPAEPPGSSTAAWPPSRRRRSSTDSQKTYRNAGATAPAFRVSGPFGRAREPVELAVQLGAQDGQLGVVVAVVAALVPHVRGVAAARPAAPASTRTPAPRLSARIGQAGQPCRSSRPRQLRTPLCSVAEAHPILSASMAMSSAGAAPPGSRIAFSTPASSAAGSPGPQAATISARSGVSRIRSGARASVTPSV